MGWWSIRSRGRPPYSCERTGSVPRQCEFIAHILDDVVPTPFSEVLFGVLNRCLLVAPSLESLSEPTPEMGCVAHGLEYRCTYPVALGEVVVVRIEPVGHSLYPRRCPRLDLSQTCTWEINAAFQIGTMGQTYHVLVGYTMTSIAAIWLDVRRAEVGCIH